MGVRDRLESRRIPKFTVDWIDLVRANVDWWWCVGLGWHPRQVDDFGFGVIKFKFIEAHPRPNFTDTELNRLSG